MHRARAKGRNMRILVTGGAGFLGSHLADRLVADGHEVVCLDNLSSGRLSNVEHLVAAGRFRFIEADVIDPLPVRGPLDRIYHLASPVTCKTTLLTLVVGLIEPSD